MKTSLIIIIICTVAGLSYIFGYNVGCKKCVDVTKYNLNAIYLNEQINFNAEQIQELELKLKQLEIELYKELYFTNQLMKKHMK